jgi:hypothetical protein
MWKAGSSMCSSSSPISTMAVGSLLLMVGEAGSGAR